MSISASDLKGMSFEEMEKLYAEMKKPTKEQKKAAWKLMDTGIYNTEGELIGDRLEEEDAYEVDYE